MPTLHIEHPITDFETWSSAFDRFAEMRSQAGVLSHRIYRPINDSKYVVIDLDFESTEQAESFLRFLETNIWADRGNAPALAGAPKTMILESVVKT